jgi:pepF/M3 family oligoendopeptidase
MADKKTDLGNVPRWDLSNVYPALDSNEFKNGVKDVGAKLKAIDAYHEAHGIQKSADGPQQENLDDLGEVLSDLLTRMDEVRTLYGTLSAFVGSFTTTDSYNKDARRIESEIELHGVHLRKQAVAFRGWIEGIGKQLPELLKQDGIIGDHAYFLQESFEQSKYQMEPAEEALAADLSLSGANAWGKLQGTVVSQLSVDFELDGEMQKMPMPALINLKGHPDETVRKRAYEAEMAAWETAEEPLAAAMNGVKGEVNTLDRRRGREDALHASLDTSRIDRPTLDAMMGAMEDSFPAFRRYFKSKAEKLGKKQLAWWDVFAPVGKSDRVLKYEEARDFVLEQFASFSDDLTALSKRAFDESWIDAEMRDGKVGGAFCMSVPAVDESRILSNFDGSMDQLSTLAHELGHAYHNECLKGKGELRTITPMTLAETASIMCQTIVTNAAIENAGSKEEELAILENDLNDNSQVIVDIYSRFLFEKEVFERREKAELSADDLCEIMERAQGETYGDGLDPKYRHKYMWTWKPHYYYSGFSFYNYPYAFGLLFATGLFAIYQERGSDFVDDYRNLLASTGEANAADLAARFGIDIREKKFWADSLKVIEKKIERYEAL